MKQENIKFISKFDGLELDVLLLIPDSKIKGIVQIAHGMAEHKERYIDFMEFLVSKGYVACINDHRGHGLSIKAQEDLGYFYDSTAQAITQDLHDITLYLKDRFKDVPFTLLGHSMGSLVVRDYARKFDEDLDRLIISGSPSKNSASDIALKMIDIMSRSKGDRYISPVMINLTTGAYDKAFPEEGHNSWLSVNKENVDKYNSDPLCGFPFTLNGYRNLMILMKEAYLKNGWQMENKSLPILFISGENDPCAVSKKAWNFAVEDMKSHGYTDVRGIMYEGMRHEILNEDKKKDVYNDILEFIKKGNA